jgi:hypothetical protein
MLARFGASLKGALGGYLSYADLAALMGASLTNPELLLGELAGSVYASWDAVTGSSDRTGFTERWRTKKFLPHLQAIADQPTRALQQWKLKDLLLTEQEGLTTNVQVLKLPEEQAAAFLIDYPGEAAAGYLIARNREYLGLEMGFHLLNICALLELARKGFGTNANDLQSWAGLYGNAFEHMFKIRVVLRTLHVISPESHPTREDSLSAESACEPILAKMQSLLTAIREQISYGREDIERYREFYNGIVDVKANFSRDVIGYEPQHSERV